MNRVTVFILSFILLLGLGIVTNSTAQFDDEFGDEDIEDVECIPEDLQTAYDTRVYSDTTKPIGLLYNFGYEYYKNKSYKDALPYLWRVFITDSTKYARNAIRYIARIYFDQGIVDSTLLSCYRGLEKFPNIITLHYYAGILQNKLGKSICAIPHYEEMVKDNKQEYEENPNDQEKIDAYVENLKTLAYLYYKTDDERAIDLQKKAVSLKPDDPELSNTLAQYSDYFYGKGAGTAAYRQAWLNDPDNIELARKYGEAAALSDTVRNALKPLNIVISKSPIKSDYETRAGVYENLSDYGSAISDLKKALEFTPKDVDIMLRMAQDYKLAHNFGNAKYWVNRALNTRPGYGLAYITMGEIYETAVNYCLDQRGGKVDYDDKLVYELAWKEYEKAKRDPAFRGRANTKQKFVEPLKPSKEDEFMHQGAKISSSCYTSWIK
ncbi:MAG: hypothetical protein P8X42_01685 [Calditrichaceae bacterium]